MLEQISSLGIKTIVYSAGILSGLILALFYYSATLYEEASVRQFVGKRKYIQGLFITLEYLFIPAVVVLSLLSIAPQFTQTTPWYSIFLIFQTVIIIDLALRLPKYDLEYYPLINEHKGSLDKINNKIDEVWETLFSRPKGEIQDAYILVIINSLSAIFTLIIINSALVEINFQSVATASITFFAQLLVYSLTIWNSAFASRTEEKIELIMKEGEPVKGIVLSEGNWISIRNEDGNMEEINSNSVDRIKYEERA